MANLIFNIARGRIGHLASLPASNDGLVAVVLESAGLEADATLADYDTLAALLAGSSNEQTTMGRKALTSVALTVDDTNQRLDVDAADLTWTGASGNPVGAVVICYDPDVAAGDDTTLVPLTKHDFAATPSGGEIVAQIAVSGFYRSS